MVKEQKGGSNLKINELGTNNIIKNLDISSENDEAAFKLVCENKMSIECNFVAIRVQEVKPGLI